MFVYHNTRDIFTTTNFLELHTPTFLPIFFLVFLDLASMTIPPYYTDLNCRLAAQFYFQ